MPVRPQYDILRLILGDQLNHAHGWFATADSRVLYVVAEMRQETGYVRHHIQKLCAFFAAMERFAGALKTNGHEVLYLDLDATASCEDLPALIAQLCARYRVSRFDYQRPDEYRLQKQLESLRLPGEIAVTEVDTEHFLLPFADIDKRIPRGKHVRMETFYRRMRREHRVLMDGDQPAGGRWNFDRENRQRLSEDDLAAIPEPLTFANDVSDILARLQRHQVDYFGREADPLPWPVERDQALQLLDFFCRECLPHFGHFQDAMTRHGDQRWSLYHSRLSFALNTKMLSPAEVIARAEAAYQRSPRIDLAQVEGFIRQILGWREYVRAVYWANMPDYGRRNHLRGQRALPAYFWTGDTRMRCVSEVVSQSLEHSYAHHIQRLMITGNFCLLTGMHPDAVDAWYLGIYVDAIEWVEMPNTRGMALYADGGLVGTKPYAAGGNYIKKMSDYCGDCHYRVTEKTGPRACPFNSLYWHFMDRHREELARNPRLGMLFGSWDRMGEEQNRAILSRARHLLRDLETL